ncbi:MAG TPA: ATPase domain-containing protein, partial [Candidatus Saccharibacteria bacterium]|nr:ATPase domain-containing protein [Candidatus Saccharibacteria bacterium]
MAKSRTQFICQNCGASYPKWTGKCDNCGEWNTLLEQAPISSGKSAVARGMSTGKVLPIQTIQSISKQESMKRLTTGFSDLDDVLGGGIVPGGVVLMAGQPGIGKSTLLLQVTANVAYKSPVLYVSGEESASQVKLRAERLGAEKSEQLSFAASTSADD